MRVCCQGVEGFFDSLCGIQALFFQRSHDGGQGAAHLGSGISYRSKADLPGNDRGSEVSLGQVVVCRHSLISAQ